MPNASEVSAGFLATKGFQKYLLMRLFDNLTGWEGWFTPAAFAGRLDPFDGLAVETGNHALQAMPVGSLPVVGWQAVDERLQPDAQSRAVCHSRLDLPVQDGD